MNKNAFFLIIGYVLLHGTPATCQEDPEFKKGFVLHGRLHNGMITQFRSGPELYVAGLQFVPQVTIVPALLRAGIIAGGFYSGQQVNAMGGPTASVKLKTFNAGPFGSAANVHLSVDHLWGTDKQRLIGGGIHLDLLNKITLGLTTHRDYNLNSWWIQTAIGLRLSKTAKTIEPFNQ